MDLIITYTNRQYFDPRLEQLRIKKVFFGKKERIIFFSKKNNNMSDWLDYMK